jgi:hypothetical protein
MPFPTLENGGGSKLSQACSPSFKKWWRGRRRILHGHCRTSRCGRRGQARQWLCSPRLCGQGCHQPFLAPPHAPLWVGGSWLSLRWGMCRAWRWSCCPLVSGRGCHRPFVSPPHALLWVGGRSCRHRDLHQEPRRRVPPLALEVVQDPSNISCILRSSPIWVGRKAERLRIPPPVHLVVEMMEEVLKCTRLPHEKVHVSREMGDCLGVVGELPLRNCGGNIPRAGLKVSKHCGCDEGSIASGQIEPEPTYRMSRLTYLACRVYRHHWG